MAQFLNRIVATIVLINFLVFFVRLLPDSHQKFDGWIQSISDSSLLRYVLIDQGDTTQMVGLSLVLLFLYPVLSKVVYSIARLLIKPLQHLPTSRSLEFIQRYMLILEFTKYSSQKKIFDRLIKMYEPGSKMVILPMDMEYMGAGSTKESYLQQIAEIHAEVKSNHTNVEFLTPFLFVDPRRIRNKKNATDKDFFNWEIETGIRNGNPFNYVRLQDCIVRDYLEGTGGIEDGSFKGIKIYPALGYFPFDEDLLALWSYCVQHDIPITTHCTKGTIYYRGRLRTSWQKHPVFTDADGNFLDLKCWNNYDLQVNFTHPLNYLVLLEDYFLSQLLKRYKNQKLDLLFGLNGDSVSQGLSTLKVNMAHYGGSSEWRRHLEADRSDLTVELLESPDKGVELLKVQNQGQTLYTKPAWLWGRMNADWFTIISSMMLQYQNVYADISYILRNEDLMPLLTSQLQNNRKMAKKILFGTDFFVVRNHKSERQLLVDLESYIGPDHFNLIARDNTKQFLSLTT